jgi:ferritin-like metal-binding protein YciE
MSELRRLANRKEISLETLLDALTEYLGDEAVISIIETHLESEGTLDEVIEEINENY